jgi:hypothetical protein
LLFLGDVQHARWDMLWLRRNPLAYYTTLFLVTFSTAPEHIER